MSSTIAQQKRNYYVLFTDIPDILDINIKPKTRSSNKCSSVYISSTYKIDNNYRKSRRHSAHCINQP
jgi:hypothetical protein